MSNPTGRNADPSRTIPLNSAAWRKIRAQVLDDHPLCFVCIQHGRVVPATDVDHIDGPASNDPENLMPLCHECHSYKTSRERAALPVNWGCGLDGWPLDIAAAWKSRAVERERPAAPPLFNADCES
ncbi:MAG: HNH endonuclease [Castellaniella sp.]